MSKNKRSKKALPPRSKTAVRIRENWRAIALQARWKFGALAGYSILILLVSWWLGLAILGEWAQSYQKPKA